MNFLPFSKRWHQVVYLIIQNHDFYHFDDDEDDHVNIDVDEVDDENINNMMLMFTLSPLSCTGSKSSVSITENWNIFYRSNNYVWGNNWAKIVSLHESSNFSGEATIALGKQQFLRKATSVRVRGITLKWVQVQVFNKCDPNRGSATDAKFHRCKVKGDANWTSVL